MSLADVSKPTNARIFAGFPWVSALFTYTISWGWLLVLPNTLYWDDWLYVFNQPDSYLSEIFSRTGLPPWRALVDRELLGVGYWTLRWLTFTMFFVAGLLLFEILKQIPLISAIQSQSIVILFLIVPLNHARIALVMFGYTTSYFLFFLAWLLLVKHSNWILFLSAWFCFMWSFMTHSFLFFFLLPVLHFFYLRRDQLNGKRPDVKTLVQASLLLGSPILYYVLRAMKWPADPEYGWYHTVYLRAVLVSIAYLVPFVVSATGIALWVRRGKPVAPKTLMLSLGLLAFGIGVLPYVSSGNLDSRTIFFFWELGWTSRHQLLMPLGASVICIAIVYLISDRKRQFTLVLVLMVMISLNVLWGISAYVDSAKKDELVELLSVETVSEESSSFVFIDETTRLNFRGDSYRRYEFVGFLRKAGMTSVPTVENECGQTTAQIRVVIRSDQSLLEAFFTGDLGLSIETGPCGPS